jgi:uncharacterized protein YkwD
MLKNFPNELVLVQQMQIMIKKRWLVFQLSIAAALVAISSADGDGEEKAVLDRNEARDTLEYLNQVRKEPDKFGKEIGINLDDAKARPALKWNDILAKVAEEKALDMANRDYFSHTTPEGLGVNVQIHEAGYTLPKDWVKKKDQNFFESISAGNTTGIKAIQSLIVDKDLPAALHRKHLLGMTDFYAGCTDIGIGFARRPQSKFQTYMSIIIARRK